MLPRTPGKPDAASEHRSAHICTAYNTALHALLAAIFHCHTVQSLAQDMNWALVEHQQVLGNKQEAPQRSLHPAFGGAAKGGDQGAEWRQSKMLLLGFLCAITMQQNHNTIVRDGCCETNDRGRRAPLLLQLAAHCRNAQLHAMCRVFIVQRRLLAEKIRSHLQQINPTPCWRGKSEGEAGRCGMRLGGHAGVGRRSLLYYRYWLLQTSSGT